MNKVTDCKGNCTACALTCYLRRKEYDPSWVDLERQESAGRRKRSKQ